MKLLCGVLFLILSACARPDYIHPTVNPDSYASDKACSLNFPHAGLCASLQWTNGPKSSTESEFILKFWNTTGASENGPYSDPTQALSVVLWMPSMGHGSSPVTIEKIEPGVYRVRKVYFIMPGEWEIRSFLKETGTIVDQVNVTLTL